LFIDFFTFFRMMGNQWVTTRLLLYYTVNTSAEFLRLNSPADYCREALPGRAAVVEANADGLLRASDGHRAGLQIIRLTLRPWRSTCRVENLIERTRWRGRTA
jgi:hypothetical protein